MKTITKIFTLSTISLALLTACNPNNSNDKQSSDMAKTNQSSVIGVNTASNVAKPLNNDTTVNVDKVLQEVNNFTKNNEPLASAASETKTTNASDSIIGNNDIKNYAGIQAALTKANYQILSMSDAKLDGFKIVEVVPENNKNVNLSITIHKSGQWFFDANARLLSVETGEPADVFVKSNLTTIKQYVGVGFDVSKTFKVIKGNGERKIAVFTDPDCPFCKRLEQSLKQMDNVEITYIYYPVPSLHPDAMNKVNQLWSVPKSEKATAWLKFLEDGTLPEKSLTNKNKYDYDYMKKLGTDFNISATPTLFNINTGEIQVGALDIKDLEKFASGGEVKQSTENK